MKYRIQYDNGPTLTLEAGSREEAWDQYKLRTGLRRKPGDEPPTVEAITEELTTKGTKAKN